MSIHASELKDYQAAAMRVCFQSTPADEDLAHLPGDRDRWLLYRSMVRRRIENMIRDAAPAFFEALGDPDADDLLTQFFDQRAVESPFIRDCVIEFTEFVEHMGTSSVSAALLDTLQLERARWAVRDMACEQEAYTSFDFEKQPVVNMAHQSLGLVRGEGEGPAGRRYLVIYRDPDSLQIREMRMNHFAFQLWTAWSSQRDSAMESAKRVATREEIAIDGDYLNRMCDVLAEFVDHGLMLGSRLDGPAAGAYETPHDGG